LDGSGTWHAEQAWLGRRAENVVIEVVDGRIIEVVEGKPAPLHSVRLKGWTLPGFANVHSHAFQRLLRGEVESGGGDFWRWRDRMYGYTAWDPADYFTHARHVFREMLESGITAVGEFHYLHSHGNALGQALIDAAREEGIRLTLIDACYLRGGLDGRPLDDHQRTFSDGDADAWARRVDELRDGDRVRVAAAIHSVRAVDPESMRIVATYARERRMPLHIHLAEQPAEVEQSMAIEGCTPVELLEREGILGPDLTAVHSIHVNAFDLSLLGANRVGVCACPTTERDLGDRVAPLRDLVAAGCPLSAGSDSNAVVDMLEEARGIELDQRRATGKRVLHQPEELLAAITVNGMTALGWEAGELKPGALADFVTFEGPELERRELSPAYLVFALSGRGVTNVVVGGRTAVTRP
jgi:formiminoglutamate deiminase